MTAEPEIIEKSEKREAAIWQAINTRDLNTLMKLLRSHPDVVGIDIVTATDLERMASNDG